MVAENEQLEGELEEKSREMDVYKGGHFDA